VIPLALCPFWFSYPPDRSDPGGVTSSASSAVTSSGAEPPRPRPAGALADLIEGNRRFVEGRPRYGHDVAAAAATSHEQHPRAFIVGCIDSRVPLEAVFDQTFGAVCVGRSGGQVLDRALVGSVEFAVSALGVPLLMVLGHERCGAVAATVAALREGGRPAGDLGFLVDEIAPAVTATGLDDPDVCARALRRHVLATARRLAGNPVVAAAVAAGDLAVVAGLYDLDTGRVELLPLDLADPVAPAGAPA
jgi:carbonic anhydrase